jgi:hypothetical protein
MIIADASLQIKPVHPVAHGGFGDVFRGKCDGRPAAVKVMRLWVSSGRDLDDLIRVCTIFHAVRKQPALNP